MSRLPSAGGAEVVVPASPEAVWAVLTDVTRIGEWSHEAHGAHWTRGDCVALGSVFRGDNAVGWVRWSRPCTVTELVEPSLFSYLTNGGRIYGDNSRWTFTLTPEAAGTRIVQRFTVENMPRWFERFIVTVLPSHLDRSAALEADLRRLGEVAAADFATKPDKTR